MEVHPPQYIPLPVWIDSTREPFPESTLFLKFLFVTGSSTAELTVQTLILCTKYALETYV